MCFLTAPCLFRRTGQCESATCKKKPHKVLFFSSGHIVPCGVKSMFTIGGENMGNKLRVKWTPSNDEVIISNDYFSLVKSTNKAICGYYHNGIVITTNSFCKKSTYAHEYVHMVEAHKGVNNPSNEYLANRVSSLLAKHYKWNGLKVSFHNMMHWKKQLTSEEVSCLNDEAKKLAQNFLVDEKFQEGIKLLENL